MLVTVWVSSLFGLYVSRTPGLKPCGQRLLGFGLQVFGLQVSEVFGFGLQVPRHPFSGLQVSSLSGALKCK